MLDDHAGRALGERFHTLQCRIGIRHVVIGQFLALHLPCGRHRGLGRRVLDKERGALMRVLAVTHGLDLPVLQVERGREIAGRTVRPDRTQVIRDCAIVARRMFERLDGQRITRCIRDSAVVIPQLLKHHGVIRAIHDHGNRGMVLGGRTQQGRSADIDVLDGHEQVAVITGNGLLERVEVDHHQVDRADTVGRHHRLVRTAAREDAAMYFRMQRLDPAIHHLRETGVVRHFNDRNTFPGQQRGRAAGRQYFDAARVQCLRKFGNTVLIRDADQGPLDRGRASCIHQGVSRLYCLSFLRSVPRLMPSISAAWVWLPSTCTITTPRMAGSTSFMTTW